MRFNALEFKIFFNQINQIFDNSIKYVVQKTGGEKEGEVYNDRVQGQTGTKCSTGHKPPISSGVTRTLLLGGVRVCEQKRDKIYRVKVDIFRLVSPSRASEAKRPSEAREQTAGVWGAL